MADRPRFLIVMTTRPAGYWEVNGQAEAPENIGVASYKDFGMAASLGCEM
jgi:hypothetical protein